MNLNFNEICRLCLRICEEYVDLNQTNGVKTLADDLAEKIKYCYFVQVDLSEGFPTKVCYECIQVLSFFYTAKKNVISTDKLLREILFVRKKLEEETKGHTGENVTSPDIIEIKQDKQKTIPVVVDPKSSEPKIYDESRVKVMDVELNSGDRGVSNFMSSTSPTVETEKEIIVCDIDESPTLGLEKHDSKVRRRKKLEQLRQSVAAPNSAKSSILAKLLTPTNSNLKDFKKEQPERGKSLPSAKGHLQLEVDPPLKENIVKEIGTVIDTNNILSPNVKRTRKSISAR